MRKVIMPAVCVIALLAGIWSLDAGTPPDVDPVVSGSIRKPADLTGDKLFSVSNVEAQTACAVSRGEKLTNRSMRFAAARGCEQVWPGLSNAATWTETGDGTVVLSNAAGDAILTLAEGDGPAYETVDPSNAMITLNGAD
ncbi:AprI/Inh family metalloprotease inhibitor [Rhizobium sp. ARZ01]|uniref:AprI/Inh family metalloprotease inhibitor n=1 Tax=Rhizobium sp. ARZ01 TaxID=2769313 RepID=UPI001786A307|nr:AprI/Inh family metalloprotease inhibitor [Rhizobium sp. ARZ01]MBD9373569.1 AprI/Inh family metalloprotease inhibitor [Rhizobium sp. ARZ01]